MQYQGVTINNKGILSDHITEIERKVKGATANVISETGNTEFIIIPIMTYAYEGWTKSKEDNKQTKHKLYSMKQRKLSCLYLSKDTLTTLLFNETGNIPIEHTIKEKKSL